MCFNKGDLEIVVAYGIVIYIFDIAYRVHLFR